jgi:hypothetical protein
MAERSVSEWNGYVVSGKTRAQRRERLEQVPDEWKPHVENHVRTFFAIKNNAKRIKNGKRPIVRW